MRRFETNLTDIIAGAAPWAAPIPTAWLVGRSTMVYLGWPWPVAAAAALVIECLGLASVHTALELREYNAARRKTDPPAPFVLAAALVGLYVGVAVSLTLALDVLPQLATWAPAIFPLLSLAGVSVLALRSDHRRRLAGIAQDKAERRAERQAAREAAPMVKRTVTRPVMWQPDMTPDNDMLHDMAGMTAGQIMAAYGISERTAYRWLARARRNGHHAEMTT